MKQRTVFFRNEPENGWERAAVEPHNASFTRNAREYRSEAVALRGREQLLAHVFETMRDGVLVLNTDYEYTYWNKRMEEISNAPREEVLGSIPWEKFPFLRGDIETAMKGAMRGEAFSDIELKYALSNGREGWTTESYLPLKDTDAKIVGVVGVIQDITERKYAHEELRHLRNYLANIIDSMPSVMVGVGPDGLVTQWNSKAALMTGLSSEAAAGQSLYEAIPRLSAEAERIEKAIQTGQVSTDLKRAFYENGETRYEDLTIYPLVASGMKGAVIRIDDVTEQVRLEEILIQNEKMLSVGGLAAGMAHEINNPLSGMMQTAQVMSNRLGGKTDLPANREAAEAAGTSMATIRDYMAIREIPRMLTAISETGRRVAAIVNNMLSFARMSEARASFHDLVEMIDKTLELAATDYDLKKRYDFKTIEIKKEYEDNLPGVPCEGPKIQQVLLNVFRNGAQAMREAKTEGPRLIVRARFEEKRQMACIEVEDNGPGMDEGTRRRVFEPFYTTKALGAGTGLGLSVSYFIITKNHGGEMAVESRPGYGAKFIIRLPSTACGMT